MNKLGIQWQRETDAVLEYNRLVQPTVLKSINCRTREFWQQLTNDNPNSIRIYRHYPNYDDWRDEPEQCAVNAVHAIMAAITHIQDLITHIEDNNEWVFPFFSDVEIDAADRYMETFIKTAWNSFGMRTVFLNSACGHWGDDITVFQRTLQAAEQYGAIVGQHEYDYPTMMRIYEETGDYWLCGKWQKSMAAIKAAGYKNIKCVITECGIDGGVADLPMKGWRNVPNSLENYCASLLWYNDVLINDEDVLGTAIFIISGHGEWGSFDIEGSEVLARIALFPTVPPPEPPDPEPPPNGDDQMVDVYDFDGNLKDWDWLKQNFGDVKIRPIEEMWQPQQGDRVYKVKYFRAKRGYSSCLINVRDREGRCVVGETVIWGYSSAAPHGYSNKGWNWTEIGDAGDTNSTGDVGPGMSKDGYYAPPDGGPYWCWVWDHPSEMVTGLGMIAGTFHDHVDVGYQEELYGDGEPPDPEPPDPEPPSELLDVVKEQLEVSKRILGHVAVIREIVEQEPPDPEPPDPEPPEPEEAFRAYFYNNTELSGEPVHDMRDVPPFWHNWGAQSPVPNIVNADNISGRWIGTFTFEETKVYTFNVKTDDGARLFVGGKKVLDVWFPQGATLYSIDVPLTQGKHEVVLEWFERGGHAVLHFNWQ